MNKDELFLEMKNSIIEGSKEKSEKLAKIAVEKQMDLIDVVEKGFVAGIQVVGDLWEQGEYFLPELIAGAECMKAAMSVIQPELEKAHLETKSQGKVVIGTIQGDIHDIGKNLVSAMLSANGFDVIDLGADVELGKFLKTAEAEKADLICLSALLTTTMLGQKKLIEMHKEQESAGSSKVLVGGAPVNRKWADDIDADGYAENAMTAVDAAKALMNKIRN